MLVFVFFFHTKRDSYSSNQAGLKPKQKQPECLAPGPSSVYFPRCKTFSSDLLLIGDAWCGVCVLLSALLVLLLCKKARKGRATVRIQSGRDLRKIVVTAESIPRLLSAGRGSGSSTDCLNWLLWVLWERMSVCLAKRLKDNWLQEHI